MTSWQYLYHMKDLNPNIGKRIYRISRSVFVCAPCLISLNYLNFSTYKLCKVTLQLCLAMKWHFLGAGKSCNCADSSLVAPCNERTYVWKHHNRLSALAFLPDVSEAACRVLLYSTAPIFIWAVVVLQELTLALVPVRLSECNSLWAGFQQGFPFAHSLYRVQQLIYSLTWVTMILLHPSCSLYIGQPIKHRLI